MTDTRTPSPAFPAPLRWLARRLVVPAFVSTLLVEAIMFFAWAATLLYSVPLHERGDLLGGSRGLLMPGLVIGAVLVVLIGVGLLLFGVPAGYLVARLRLGFALSLTGLVVLGTIAGAMVMMLIGGPGGAFNAEQLAFALMFPVSGAATAAVWTFINADLFRRNEGA